jgi:GT2 family glycosyltransferase/glycosyltransferase involved in cell wall biosynthesis
LNTEPQHSAGKPLDGVTPALHAQPYYIYAPEAGRQSMQSNLLHRLCDALNAQGYQAYLEGSGFSGELWTPPLTEVIRAAHYQAGKTPIVVGPQEPKTPLNTCGLQVRYLTQPPASGAQAPANAHPVVTYVQSAQPLASHPTLFMPALDAQFVPETRLLPAAQRTAIAFFNSRFVAAGGQSRDFGPHATDLSAARLTDADIRAVLCQARLLYAYEPSAYIDWARFCGCAVVMLPNAFTLKAPPSLPQGMDTLGICWGEEGVEQALASVAQWRAAYLEQCVGWQHSLQAFVQDTQRAANALPPEQAWPQASIDQLDLRNLSPQEMGARADRKKYRRLNEQFERWSSSCTLREVDADIYAEYLSTGKVPALALLIDQRGCAPDALADTLDNLGECLWQPAQVLIVSDQPAPEALDTQSHLQWITVAAGNRSALQAALPGLTDWVLLVQSGTRLAAQSLVEWGLATSTFPGAELLYADDCIWQADGPAVYPFFKPDANVELLRSTNYLGNALLARTTTWGQAGCPLFDGGLYGYALQLLQTHGRPALGHIDTVLVQSSGNLPAGVESREFDVCARVALQLGLADKVRPLERLGTWLVDYAATDAHCVSLVVPTGIQTGYLRALLESLSRYPQEALAEVVLVCQPAHRDEVEYALGHIQLDIPVRIVLLEQSDYSHAAALNAGVTEATSTFVLVCDDDTEALHPHWLRPLLGIAQQADVGCVAPRLMSNRGTDARVSGGPMVLGVNGSYAPYNGETGSLDESGAHSRLLLTQDVGAVAGHCFLFRKADWAAVNGFDVQNFGLLFCVLDFCLRLGRLGKRHVWTPLSSVLHQGGKTLESVGRDMRTKVRLADAELNERENLLRLWAKELATDACYNRHLSFQTPFDIEQTIVIDWQPRRKDRPRVLACPLTSGAGQYRVIEPLNALQDASLAQTCAIIPLKRRESRSLQPLELVRAAPDRLLLQHSVDDAHFGLIEKYRLAMPGIQIIQTVDDLLGEVPEKHPNRNFQMREGHQRMAHILKQSDRLVVTTETLMEHYKKYVPDVWLVPNCLDKQWSNLRLPKAGGSKLRVGWVGAGQHQGDLEMVSEVVKALATEVEWVFMGMCTDAIKPYISEFHDFVQIADYPEKMASLRLDIAIAPLEQNFFNDCKSNLRLLEYGAMGWPVVCSDVFPYRYLNPPVLRCANQAPEWIAALRKLIEDASLRTRMAEDLHQWVQGNFLLKNRTQEWMAALFEPA